MTPPDRLEALADIARILDELGLVYAIGGSLASARWGVPRLTNDVDVVVVLPPERVVDLVRAVEARFFVDEVAVQAAAVSRRSVNLLARDDFTKVDLFVADDSPWQRQQLARRRRQVLPPDVSPHPVYFASPEDTVLAKLRWFEQGHRVSDRQWQDVCNVLRVQGPALDMAYLRYWAVELGLGELLVAALAATGLTADPMAGAE